MSKRLAFLEKLVSEGKADSFGRYALAMEYKSLGRVDDAVAAFDALRAADPKYVPMYLMAGTMLAEAGRAEAARPWLTQGVDVARAAGDTKALGELQDALGRLG